MSSERADEVIFEEEEDDGQKTGRDEKEVLKAIEYVHELLDKEVAAEMSPTDILVSGMSQGGALAKESVLLYPKTLGSCAVFSVSVPLTNKLQVNAEESSDDLANPPKVEEKLGAVPHGLSTDSEVAQRCA
eukprot:XP_008657579.1 probable carboxylesterase Os04g0669600 [Zea mays]